MSFKRDQLTGPQKLALELQRQIEHDERQLIWLEREYLYNSKKSNRTWPSKEERVIRILEKELLNLKTDLDVATTPFRKKADFALYQDIVGILHEYDKICEEIKKRKTEMSEMVQQIFLLKKKLTLLQKGRTSNLQMEKRIVQGQRTLETLQNKLEVATKMFGSICFENKALRNKLEFLMTERATFNKIWEQIINRLCLGKKYMIDLIDQVTMAYDDREEYCSKLQALRLKASKDIGAEDYDMSKLSRANDDFRQVVNFFYHKNAKITMIDLEEKALQRRQARQKKIQEKLSEYHEMLRQINDFTGGHDMDEVLKIFTQIESENFSTFNYINELHQEMEDISDKLAGIHEDIKEHKAAKKIYTDKQDAVLDKLRKELKEIRHQRHQNDSKLESIHKKIENIVEETTDIFRLMGCSEELMMSTFLGDKQCNYKNILLYLETIEQQILNKLVGVYHKEKHLASKRLIRNEDRLIWMKKSARIFSIDEIVPASPCPLCFEHEQVSDVIDSLQRVLSRKEINDKLIARLQLPGASERIHTVPNCQLPKARKIMQLALEG